MERNRKHITDGKSALLRLRRHTAAVLSGLAITLPALLLSGCSAYNAVQKIDNAVGLEKLDLTGIYDKLFYESGEGTDAPDSLRVTLQEAEGLKITSQNPVSAAAGDSVSFTCELEEGWTVDGINGGVLSEDGRITVSDVRYPTSVSLLTRRLTKMELTAQAADFGDSYGDLPGTVKASTTSFWSETPVTLKATPGEYFEFVCFTEGAPASEGGKVISEEAEYTYSPAGTEDGKLNIYANFRRVSALIKMADSDGIRKIMMDEIVAKVGAHVNFVFEVEEGIVVNGVSEGATLSSRTITVDNITKPLTVSVYTTRLAKCNISVRVNDPNGGYATIDPDKTAGWEGDSFTVSAFAEKHYTFTGWSTDKPLSEGGQKYSNASSGNITLSKDIVLYANFEVVKYSVSIPEYEGLTVTSANPVTVIAGEDATFTYTLESGYMLDDLPYGITADGGTITVKNILADTTADVHTFRGSYVQYRLFTDDSAFGSATSNVSTGKYRTGTVITAKAEAGSGTFIGWSTGKSVANGGTVVSKSATYMFALSKATDLYANYTDPADTVSIPADSWVILYHPNGGTNTKSQTNSYYSEIQDNTFYFCPNALPDMGYFTRDGYVLFGYNTKPDGSGDYYAPGWNIKMPEGRKSLSLFCIWIKETDVSLLRYRVVGNSVTLTGYTGTDETVVVPLRINGLPVTTVSTGFIASNPTVKALFLSRNVTAVSANAVANCKNLEKFYLPDSVKSIPDNWYSSCPNLYQLNMIATRMPYNPTSCYGTYTVKYDRMKAQSGNRILIVSGSNSAYGINSPELMKLLKEKGYDYTVINFGQNAGSAACFYMEACLPLMHEGDILLHEPELNKFQYGYNEINSNIWNIFEGSYDGFANVDIRHYTKVYSSFTSWNKGRGTSSTKNYSMHTNDVNNYGDYSRYKEQVDTDSTWMKWKPTLDNYDANGGKGSTSFNSGVELLKNSSQIAELNRVYDMFAEKKITVLFSFAVIVKTCLTPASQIANGAEQTAYCEAVDKYLHATRISVPATYIFDRQYSYNSNYHITSSGAVKRVGLLAQDLDAYFKSQKKN